MALRGRIGALRQAALYGPGAFSEPGRRAATSRLRERLLAEIDAASPGLPDDERERRFEYARRAYFQQLGLRSAAARRRPKNPAGDPR